ncbi:MAG: ribosome silencing factor [Lachnospiraceae bacterium]|nr:ribosome silencing factor [Lachnospiraceae bacterium]
MEAKEIADIAVSALEEKKAEDVKVIDVHDLTPVADYFVLATASNPNQLEALVDNVDEKLNGKGINARSIEGRPKGDSNWILMDYNTVIVHVFNREGRQFYDLERLWQNAG